MKHYSVEDRGGLPFIMLYIVTLCRAPSSTNKSIMRNLIFFSACRSRARAFCVANVKLYT